LVDVYVLRLRTAIREVAPFDDTVSKLMCTQAIFCELPDLVLVRLWGLNVAHAQWAGMGVGAVAIGRTAANGC
jgi:hypothetical protein